MKSQGAQFEISIDGVPRSSRDRRGIAVEAAGQPWQAIDYKSGLRLF